MTGRRLSIRHKARVLDEMLRIYQANPSVTVRAAYPDALMNLANGVQAPGRETTHETGRQDLDRFMRQNGA